MRTASKETEFRVGLFVLLGIMAIVAFSFRLTESPIFQRGIEVTTYLNDATGLFKLTKVKQAGIPIGYVKDIHLEGNRAKITLIIEKEYQVPRGSRVVARPLGVLGDKYLELRLPSQKDEEESSVLKPESRNEKLPPSKGDVSRHFLEETLIEGASFVGEFFIPSAMGAQNRPGLLKQGDVLEAGDSGSSVDDLTRDAADISKDIKATSSSVRTLVENNAAEIQSLIRSLNRMTIRLEKTLNKVDTERLGEDLRNLSQAAGRMSRSLENVESITKKIDEGEGTLGKLVNDPTTAEELNKSLSHLNHAIERSGRIQTIVDMWGSYRTPMKTTKTFVELRIMTRETSGYLAQVVMDPVGRTRNSVIRTRINGGQEIVTETITTSKTSLLYTVQFYKRIGETAFRLGLVENTGGLGIDFFLWRDRVRWTIDAFAFSRENDNPHLRTYLRIPFFTYLYAQAGGEELMTRMRSSERRPSLSLGLGLKFTDEDIKTLFLLPGIP